MKNLLILCFPLSSMAIETFTIGLAEYSTSWQTQSQTFNGSNFNYIQTLSSSSGPVAVFTFTYNFVDYSNLPTTDNTLASIVLSGTFNNYQTIYPTNGSLSSFTTTALNNYQTLSFVNTTNGFSNLNTLYMQPTNGLFLPNPAVGIPLQPLTISQPQISQIGNNNVIVSAIIGQPPQNRVQINNNRGNINGFSQDTYYPAPYFSIPSLITSASNNQYVTTAFAQNLAGFSSIQVYRQSTTSNDPSYTLSDFNQTGVYFLNYQPSGYLFFGENTVLGTRVGASSFSSNGFFLPPLYLSANFSFSSSTGINYFQDPSNNVYILWNGSSQIYVAAFNLTQVKWKTVLSGSTTFFGKNLPVATPFSSGLYLAQATANSTSGLNVSALILNNSNFGFGSLTLINQTKQGTITPFSGTPTIQLTVDGSNNVISVFSGPTSNGNKIFSNVFLNASQTYLGLAPLNSDTPTAIGPPNLANSGGQIACAWYENLNNTYSIFASLYNPTTQIFGTPTQIFTGFSGTPTIVANPSSFGFIISGTN